MTSLNTLMNRVNRDFIGFDDLFSLLDRTEQSLNANSYPPYNVIKDSDTEFTVEIAVAGFSEDDLDITVKNRELRVIGKKQSDEREISSYMHKGISNRNFERCYQLARNIEIDSADLVNGLLVIKLVLVVPDAEQPQKIALGKKTSSES